MWVFYKSKPRSQLIGYADVAYLSYPHKVWSQIGYLFTYGGTAISRPIKQTKVFFFFQIMRKQFATH